MNDLKYELEKQLLYCQVMEKFRAAVYVSSKDKIGCVKNILFDIFDDSFPIKPFDMHSTNMNLLLNFPMAVY